MDLIPSSTSFYSESSYAGVRGCRPEPWSIPLLPLRGMPFSRSGKALKVKEIGSAWPIVLPSPRPCRKTISWVDFSVRILNPSFFLIAQTQTSSSVIYSVIMVTKGYQLAYDYLVDW